MHDMEHDAFDCRLSTRSNLNISSHPIASDHLHRRIELLVVALHGPQQTRIRGSEPGCIFCWPLVVPQLPRTIPVSLIARSMETAALAGVQLL